MRIHMYADRPQVARDMRTHARARARQRNTARATTCSLSRPTSLLRLHYERQEMEHHDDAASESTKKCVAPAPRAAAAACVRLTRWRAGRRSCPVTGASFEPRAKRECLSAAPAPEEDDITPAQRIVRAKQRGWTNPTYYHDYLQLDKVRRHCRTALRPVHTPYIRRALRAHARAWLVDSC